MITYGADYYVTIRCRCGHAGVAAVMYGVLLPEIQRRGRCRRCQRRQVVGVTVHGVLAGYPELGGWRFNEDGTRDRITAEEWPVVDIEAIVTRLHEEDRKAAGLVASRQEGES